MQYYVVTLPTTQKISESKAKIKQVCVCEMKNYEVQQVIVQVSSGNIFILQNKGFIVEQINGYNESLFATFQEPKSVHMAIKNHNKKKEQQQQQQQQNQQQGMPQGQNNKNQRHNPQQQNAYQNQPNYQNQRQPNQNQRQVHNENVEQIFQQKQYQPQQNFNPQQHNQQRPNPVQQKPVPMNYMGQAKPQQPVQQYQQQMQQPFQQPVQQARPIQQFQQPVQQVQYQQQQQYQQPRNQGFPQIPQIPQVQAPVPVRPQVSKITLKSLGAGQEFINKVITYLLQNYTGCAFQIQGNDIIASGLPQQINQIKEMVAQHYQGTFIISE
ncbi:Hypothetical_protein [Hexamita inflata]|uniref:Hypothetical_protein n=1 Tax=Hexamita inflata TaxID=28002 RepID=A0AA86URS8_9EUKA|nr:Hypothetical protein HINF_LOCUS49741 [Hexamita inflata]